MEGMYKNVRKKSVFNKTKKMSGSGGADLNPNTLKAEFEARLVYRVGFGTVRAMS